MLPNKTQNLKQLKNKIIGPLNKNNGNTASLPFPAFFLSD